MGPVRQYKIACVVSHPIQYQAPLFRALASQSNLYLMVYFCWNFGMRGAEKDVEFGRTIQWDIPLLDGYRYRFLKNISPRPSSNFWGQINFGIIPAVFGNRYDAILVFGWNSFTNWLAFGAAVLSGTKILMRGESPLNQELLKAGWKLALKKLILRPLFKRISVFLYIGEENKKFYEYYGVPSSKLIFCPYAVDNDRFTKAAAKLRSRRKELRKKLLGVDNDRPIILFVGKFIEKKRPMDLIRAYELVKNPKKSLVMVGDGKLKGEAERYTRERGIENVIFAGFKNQTELPEYYALADVLVLPSGAGETWGLVVNEAMCFGLPVVVSDMVGCGPDLVRSGENGFVYPVGDVKALAGVMSEVIEGGLRLKTFGVKSLEIIAKYSFDDDAKAVLSAVVRC